jgi:hypothetical protein
MWLALAQATHYWAHWYLAAYEIAAEAHETSGVRFAVVFFCTIILLNLKTLF